MLEIYKPKNLRFIVWIAVFMFFSTAFGTLTPWTVLFLKIDTVALSLMVAYVLNRKRKRLFASVFVFIAIIFNPIIPLHLAKNLWQLIDLAAAVLFGSFAWSYIEDYEKGKYFQEFIEELFPKEFWVIVDKTKDFTGKLGRMVFSDMNPDYTFQNIESKKRIAIECKYRSKFYNRYGENGLTWDYSQGNRYEMYGNKEKIPVFVSFGVGGRPKRPSRLFICPLEMVNGCQNGFISESLLKTCERNAQDLFLKDFE